MYDNECYTFRADVKNWWDAESICANLEKENNHHLVSMPTERIQNLTIEVMKRFGIPQAWAGSTGGNMLLWRWAPSKLSLIDSSSSDRLTENRITDKS